MLLRLCGALLLQACASLAVAQGVARIDRVAEPGLAAWMVVAPQHLPERAYTAQASSRRLEGMSTGRGAWRIWPQHPGAERLLVFYNPYGAQVTVWAPPDYRPQRRHLYDPALDPRHSRHALVFALAPVAAGAPLPQAQAPPALPQPVYVHIEGGRGYPLRIEIAEPAAFAAADLGHVRAVTAIAAVIAAMALVVLLFWTLLRERLYGLLALSLVLQCLYVLSVSGEAYALPFLRWLGAFGAAGPWGMAMASAAASIWFLREFVELPRRTPQLARVLGAIVLTLLLLLLVRASPWPADKPWLPELGIGVLLLANVAALIALVRAWRHGSRGAGFLLIAWLPLIALSSARVVQLAAGLDFPSWLEYGTPAASALAAVVLALGLADRMLAFRRERDLAQQHAERDPLTGVLNRSGIRSRLDYAIEQSHREWQAVSVLFLDLDHFKRINDDFGHALGDDCLRALVQVVGCELRQGDLIGRLGGEEFLVVLPGANRSHAQAAGERIRRGVETRCVKVGGQPVGLTVSIGVAECRGGRDSADLLIARADHAMYAAKRAGRNRVVVENGWNPPP